MENELPPAVVLDMVFPIAQAVIEPHEIGIATLVTFVHLDEAHVSRIKSKIQ